LAILTLVTIHTLRIVRKKLLPINGAKAVSQMIKNLGYRINAQRQSQINGSAFVRCPDRGPVKQASGKTHLQRHQRSECSSTKT